MATFSLNVTTDDSAELLDIVSKIAGSMPLPVPRMTVADVAETDGTKMLIPTNVGVSATPTFAVDGQPTTHGPSIAQLVDGGQLPPPTPDQVPERDAHGIKRDDRIHANAADPFKTGGTWKRRKNVPDEQYEEIHLELVREARAAGLYTGPAIPELELEARVGPFYWSHPESSGFGVVDTLAQLEETLAADACAVEIDEAQYLKLQAEDSAVTVTIENHTDAQLVVAQEAEAVTVTAVAPPAPTPVAPPAPAQNLPAAIVEDAAAMVVAQQITGMSAEATPTYQQAVVALFNAGGPTAPQVALQAMGLTIATQASPQQLRDMVTAAEMVTALGITPADKPTKGPEHTREALAALGYVA